MHCLLSLFLLAFISSIEMEELSEINSYGYLVDIIIDIKNASDAISTLQSNSDLKYSDDLSQALVNLQEIQHDCVYSGTQPKDNLNNYYELLEDTEGILNKVKTQLDSTETEMIYHLNFILKIIQSCLIQINNYQKELYTIEANVANEDCQIIEEKPDEQLFEVFKVLDEFLVEAKDILAKAQVELINGIKKLNVETDQIGSKDADYKDKIDAIFALAGRLKEAKNFISKIQSKVGTNNQN
jgi:hypothetical protein